MQTLSTPKTLSIMDAERISDTALLVQMIKSHSEKGFNILYNKYSGALYGVLIKLVRHTDVANDLLQDTFVKIWKHIDGFDSERGTIYTWMLNIARNLAIDYLRSSGYRKQLLNVNLDLYSENKEFMSTSAFNMSELEVKDFRKKALQLDPKYAEVIDMVFFYGWTHEQTAQIMSLPLGTVKTRARKGLGMLKTLYLQ